MKKILLSLLGVLVTGVLVGYGLGLLMKQGQKSAVRMPIVIEQQLPPRELQLYFADTQGRYLVPEARQIPGCDVDQDCIQRLISELVKGSQQDSLPIFPLQAQILSVELENDLVRIDFSQQLVDYHPGGSLSELLTVYGLTNSLAENFSYLRQVQILVEGEVLHTLKGHVRIDQPVYADFSFSRSTVGSAPDVAEEQSTEQTEQGKIDE